MKLIDLLNEEAEAGSLKVYHRTRISEYGTPEELWNELKKGGDFKPGGGDFYGSGLYTFLSQEVALDKGDRYGNKIIEFKVGGLDKFFIFDLNIFNKIYHKNETSLENIISYQCRKFNIKFLNNRLAHKDKTQYPETKELYNVNSGNNKTLEKWFQSAIDDINDMYHKQYGNFVSLSWDKSLENFVVKTENGIVKNNYFSHKELSKIKNFAETFFNFKTPTSNSKIKERWRLEGNNSKDFAQHFTREYGTDFTNRVNGIIYTGGKADGDVCVIYPHAIHSVTPIRFGEIKNFRIIWNDKINKEDSGFKRGQTTQPQSTGLEGFELIKKSGSWELYFKNFNKSGVASQYIICNSSDRRNKMLSVLKNGFVGTGIKEVRFDCSDKKDIELLLSIPKELASAVKINGKTFKEYMDIVIPILKSNIRKIPAKSSNSEIKNYVKKITDYEFVDFLNGEKPPKANIYFGSEAGSGKNFRSIEFGQEFGDFKTKGRQDKELEKYTDEVSDKIIERGKKTKTLPIGFKHKSFNIEFSEKDKQEFMLSLNDEKIVNGKWTMVVDFEGSKPKNTVKLFSVHDGKKEEFELNFGKNKGFILRLMKQADPEWFKKNFKDKGFKDIENKQFVESYFGY